MSAVNAPGIALAFVAGAISITSPCCLPLLPGYVGYLTGLSAARLGGLTRRLARSKALVQAGSGAILVAMGALLVTDRWLPLMAPVLAWYAQARWPPI